MTDLRSFLQKLHNNLQILQEREAKFAGNAPLDLLNQIEDHKKAIALVEEALAGILPLASLKTEMDALLVDLGQSTFAAPACPDFYRYHHPPKLRPRLELLTEIKQKLLFGSGVLALHGMGGIGKSVLARALCDDPDIRATFAVSSGLNLVKTFPRRN